MADIIPGETDAAGAATIINNKVDQGSVGDESVTTATGTQPVSEALDRRLAVRSVEEFGAAGDGVADDSTAFQLAFDWLVEGDYRHLTTGFGKVYKLGAACSANFLGKKGCVFNMRSPIRPDPGIGDAFTFEHTRESEFNLYVDGGGQDADYTQADPIGADQAFVFQGIRLNAINIKSLNYAGRVSRTKNAGAGQYKTSFNEFNMTGGDQASVDGGPIGQMYYFQGDTAFGDIERFVSSNEKYGSICDSLVDITYKYLETGVGQTTGMEWRGCGSVWIETMLLGDETGTLTTAKFTVNGGGGKSRRITIGTLFAVNPAIGVHFDRLELTEPGFSVSRVLCQTASECAVKVTNSRHGDATIYSNGDDRALIIEGSDSRHLDFNVMGRDSGKECVLITGGQNIDINGESIVASKDSPGTYACVKVESLGNRINFTNFDTVAGDASGSYDLSASNNVSIYGGRLEDQPAFLGAEPKRLRNVEGAVSENSGLATIPSGANSVVVNHGLYGEPDTIQLQGRGSAEVSAPWYSSTNSTAFSINVASAVTADRTISWQVSRNAF